MRIDKQGKREPASRPAPGLETQEGSQQECLYFAYGSNMDLLQMDYRCPAAEVIGNVRLMDYRLTFCSRNPDSGVATILPEKGGFVDGVLWRITADCEKSLNRYEGYPYLYGKEMLQVQTADGESIPCMAYVMNAPYKDYPAVPSQFYLDGILRGCEQNGISKEPILAAVERTKEEAQNRQIGKKQKGWER